MDSQSDSVLRMSEMRFVLQRRNKVTGQWQTKGMNIIGKSTAKRLLNKQKGKTPNEEWRMVPKAVADAYKQGWADHEDYVKGDVREIG
jgi:hypothetical protein